MAQQACTVGWCWWAVTNVLLLLMLLLLLLLLLVGVVLLLREAGRILFEKHLPIARAVIGISSSSSPSLLPFLSIERSACLW